jgi:hypothetical protein
MKYIKKAVKSDLRALGCDIYRAQEAHEASVHAVPAPREESPEQEPEPVKPSFFICTMPKSGTMFIYTAMRDILRLTEIHVASAATNVGNAVVHAAVRDFAKGGYISVAHLCAEPVNLMYIALNMDRMLLHIRDPRNGIPSLIHWNDFCNNDRLDSYFLSCPIHRTYAGQFWTAMTYDEKVNHVIKYYYNDCIIWLKKWFEALQIDFTGKYEPYSGEMLLRNLHNIDGENLVKYDERFQFSLPCGTTVLLTTHEDMARMGDVRYLEYICRFYDPDGMDLSSYAVNKGMELNNFREGRTDSWLYELSEKHQARVTAMLPETWRNYFDWK